MENQGLSEFHVHLSDRLLGDHLQRTRSKLQTHGFGLIKIITFDDPTQEFAVLPWDHDEEPPGYCDPDILANVTEAVARVIEQKR